MSVYVTYDEAKSQQIDILSDEFDSATGEWYNLTTYDSAQLTSIQNQKHTDIRSFYSLKTILQYIISLNGATMSSLNGKRMDEVGGLFTLIPSENWTAGTVAVQSDRNNWHGISLTCAANSVTTTQSVLNNNLSIDVSSYNKSTDYITLALPAFSSNIDKSNSSIEFSSTSDFSSQVDLIKFSDATSVGSTDVELKIPLNLIVNANLSKIVGIRFKIKNQHASNSLTFKCLAIRCVSANWVYAPIDTNTQWKLVAITPTPNGAALAGSSSDFPNWPFNTNVNNLPTSWPSVYKTFNPIIQSTDFPNPVDASLQVKFNSGSMPANGDPNQIDTFFRSGNQKTTQGDLNGTTQLSINQAKNPLSISNGYSQILQKDLSIIPGKIAVSYPSTFLTLASTTLNGNIDGSSTSITLNDASGFPDSGVIYINSEYIKYSSKSSNTLTVSSGGRGYWGSAAVAHSSGSDVYYYTQINRSGNPFANQSGILQSSLNTLIQSELNQTSNITAISYLRMSIIWYSSSGNQCLMKITDETGNDLFSFTLPTEAIQPNADYVFVPSVKNKTFQLQLFKIYDSTVSDPNHMVLIYDTGVIETFSTLRSRGMVGWSASLADGDVSIQSIRSRGVTYAELKSSPILSYTPVRGTQAFINAKQNVEFANSIFGSPFNNLKTSVLLDSKKNGSDRCYQIISSQGTWQGVSTNYFVIDDFEDIDISLQLYTTSGSQNISTLLFNKEQNIIIPINMPKFDSNQWQTLNLIVNGENHPSGKYCLIVAEENAGGGSTWWVDKISVNKNQIQWYARSFVNGVNEIGADDWLSINHAINNQNYGATFTTSGRELQWRGAARTQYAEISDVNVVPNYATLGNFIKRS